MGDANPIETLAFLGRAEARLATLQALTPDPLTRHALKDAPAVPRTTLRRVLADLEDACLICRQGRVYRLTPTREGVAATVEDLLGRLGTMRQLMSIEPWLPTAAFGFDLF